MSSSQDDVIRAKKVVIKSTSARSKEQQGFDDMAAIMLGDTRNTFSNTRQLKNGEEKPLRDIIQEEENTRRKHRFVILIVGIICVTAVIITMLLIDHHNQQLDGKIRVNYSSKDLVGEDCADVVRRLEKRGFTNIKTEPLDDLITGWITKDGEVEEITIEGADSFSTGSRYSPDVEIIIKYHTFSE